MCCFIPGQNDILFVLVFTFVCVIHFLSMLQNKLSKKKSIFITRIVNKGKENQVPHNDFFKNVYYFIHPLLSYFIVLIWLLF